MVFNAIEGNRAYPFDSGGEGSKPTSWPWVRSKAIELAHSIRVVHDPWRFMALGAIEGNRSRSFDSGGTGSQALHGLGQSKSPVRLDAKCCMCQPSQTGEFLGNRTCPFDSGGAECQALHGLGCERR